MAFKDLIGRWAERRASRGSEAEGGSETDGAEAAAAAGAAAADGEEEMSKGKKAAAAAAALAGGMKTRTQGAQNGGDLATRDLTWLASQNRWGNIKGLGKPGVSQPTVDPTKPVAQQEQEEEEKKPEQEQEEEEGLVPKDTAAALDGRINDPTEGSIEGANSIFDLAKEAK